MKASEAKLLDFLKKSPQFVIPIYQRTYSWTENECTRLWDDIVRTGENDNIPSHFIGSIVYVQEGLYQVTSQSPLLVIDGQQRLTTISLLLEALAHEIGNSEPFEGFSAKKIRHYYLLNPLEKDEKKYKIILTQTDRNTLIAIIDQKALPNDHSIRIKDNFDFFRRKMAKIKDNLPIICKGLAKLVIVDISLSRDQDNPQLIFESMNSTGKELTQADLIRNFILMGLDPDHQKSLYQEHWRIMEQAFGQESYEEHFNKFMRHYLTVRTGEIPKIDEVYDAFKVYARQKALENKTTDEIVNDIHKMATFYCALALSKETDKILADAFADLCELKVDVSFPLLLQLYEDFNIGLLSCNDFAEAVRLVESYIFRRAVCAIPTNSLNKTFANFYRSIKKDKYLESIKAHFQLLPSYRRFPTNAEFEHEIKVRDLYNFRNRTYFLRKLENNGRKERVNVDEFTIEHILPQNKNLSQEWQNSLGENWQKIQETWLHTLGNLTLTAYNSEYSDRSFKEKRNMPGGFKDSPLKLNKGLASVDEWNETAIQQRAASLAQESLKVWPMPDLPEEILKQYKEVSIEPEHYTLDHYKFLSQDSNMRQFFEAFRKEVMAIDPVVTEEYLKTYIAYKAETNFVDVEPQSKNLKIWINIKFNEIHDPRRICKNVGTIGHHGNGEVQIDLHNSEDLPYVMSLVRQAFEKQIGNGGGD